MGGVRDAVDPRSARTMIADPLFEAGRRLGGPHAQHEVDRCRGSEPEGPASAVIERTLAATGGLTCRVTRLQSPLPRRRTGPSHRLTGDGGWCGFMTPPRSFGPEAWWSGSGRGVDAGDGYRRRCAGRGLGCRGLCAGGVAAASPMMQIERSSERTNKPTELLQAHERNEDSNPDGGLRPPGP